MSTAPTYATLLNSTSSSEEESLNPGNKIIFFHKQFLPMPEIE